MSKHMARTSSDTPHAVCDASPTSMEDVTPALGLTDMPSPVIQHVAPASSVTYAVPSPVTEFVAPIPGVTFDETAPVTEYGAPILGVTDTAPSPVVDHVAFASGVTFSGDRVRDSRSHRYAISSD